MALKVELKPGERIILGECVVTNADQRTRLVIEGSVPILREKDIMTAERANTPAKRIYLAVQLMYTAREPRHASRDLLQTDSGNGRCRAQRLALYRSHQQSYLNGQHVQSAEGVGEADRLRAGATIACEAQPKPTPKSRKIRQIRVSWKPTLLLRAAARLQAVCDDWDDKQSELDAALLFNRKLWTIFVTSVTRQDNPLPAPVRQNIANLGLFVMNHTMSMSFDRRPERLGSLITINRELAAGLRAQG